MRVVKAMLGVAMLGALLLAASAAFGAGTSSTPAGGTVHVFATPGNGAAGKIVITGAIGDYGKTVNIDQNGNTDPNGSFVKVTLQKGSFEVNATTLDKKLNHFTPSFNKATCSASAAGTSSVSLLDGQGLYQGISGNLKITVAFAFIGPRLTSGAHKGQCNPSNSAKPLAQYQSITGSGRVSFS